MRIPSSDLMTKAERDAAFTRAMDESKYNLRDIPTLKRILRKADRTLSWWQSRTVEEKRQFCEEWYCKL